MTLPQVIFVLVSCWMFLFILMYVKFRNENKRKLKAIQDAHKADQTVLDPHELETISRTVNLRWEELGLVSGEPPYAEVYH